jgi:guanylate kinase
MNKIKAIILAAPSGAGKTTLRKHIEETFQDVALSVSSTTREKRVGEVEGRDYYFLSQEEFESKIKAGEFAEHEEVYEGVYYGTLKEEINRINAEGKVIIFDVDVKGAVNLKDYFKGEAISIFIDCSAEELEKRLRARGSEKEAEIQKRIARFEEEFSYKKEFDFVLFNGDLDQAKKEILKLVDPNNLLIRK